MTIVLIIHFAVNAGLSLDLFVVSLHATFFFFLLLYRRSNLHIFIILIVPSIIGNRNMFDETESFTLIHKSGL